MWGVLSQHTISACKPGHCCWQVCYSHGTQVLSANPADLAGPLIMARVKPGDPHQLWFQDFWNQFGCSTRQGAVGVLGETCHIKSQAFVLINKATRQQVWAGEEGQPLTLAPYSMGSNAELTRRCTLFDLASAVPEYKIHVDCMAVHCVKPRYSDPEALLLDTGSTSTHRACTPVPSSEAAK